MCFAVYRKKEEFNGGTLLLNDVNCKQPNFFKQKNSSQLSPGQQFKHYSPNIPLRINVNKVLEGEVLLNFGKNDLKSKVFELNLSVSGNLNEAGKKLYDYLHQLDKQEYKGIAVAPIPNNDLGKTINDRLIRAIVNDSS